MCERERERSWKFVGAEWGKKAGVIQIVKVNCDFYERVRGVWMLHSSARKAVGEWVSLISEDIYVWYLRRSLNGPWISSLPFSPCPSTHSAHEFLSSNFTVRSNFNKKLLKSTVLFFSKEIADINSLTRERTIIREYIWAKLHGENFNDVKFTYFKDFDWKKKRKEKKT